MNLLEFSTLRHTVEDIKEAQELPNMGHAFGYAFLMNFYNDNDDVSDLLTEGKDDLGIDAISINLDDNLIEFFQFKYAEEYEGGRTKKIKDADLDKFSTRLEQILQKESPILEYANPKIKRKIKQIWNILENGAPKINAYFVSNYELPVDENRERAYKSSFKRKSITLEIFDSKKVISLFMDSGKPEFDTKIQFSGQKYFDSSDVDVKVFIGAVNGFTLVESLLDPSTREMSEEVFEQNVRIYLKRKTKINRQIYESALSNQNSNFFYFNNGITVTCDDIKFTRSDGPVVEIRNMQIVNGSQTIHALYDVYSDPNLRDRLKNIYLLVRIYGTKNKELGQQIATFTNTQNPVKSRDTRSNDDRQKMLESQLATEGYSYQRKKNQHSEKGEKIRIIDSEKVGQVILAFYLQKPGDSKNKKTIIFDREYESIFDTEKINAHYVLLPFLLYKEIELRVRKLKRLKREILDRDDYKEDLLKFDEAHEFKLHSQYYVLLACRFIAISKKIEVKYENLDKIIEFIDDSEKIIHKIISSGEYKKKDPSEIFKQNNLVEDLITELNIFI